MWRSKKTMLSQTQTSSFHPNPDVIPPPLQPTNVTMISQSQTRSIPNKPIVIPHPLQPTSAPSIRSTHIPYQQTFTALLTDPTLSPYYHQALSHNPLNPIAHHQQSMRRPHSQPLAASYSQQSLHRPHNQHVASTSYSQQDPMSPYSHDDDGNDHDDHDDNLSGTVEGINEPQVVRDDSNSDSEEVQIKSKIFF